MAAAVPAAAAYLTASILGVDHLHHGGGNTPPAEAARPAEAGVGAAAAAPRPDDEAVRHRAPFRDPAHLLRAGDGAPAPRGLALLRLVDLAIAAARLPAVAGTLLRRHHGAAMILPMRGAGVNRGLRLRGR